MACKLFFSSRKMAELGINESIFAPDTSGLAEDESYREEMARQEKLRATVSGMTNGDIVAMSHYSSFFTHFPRMFPQFFNNIDARSAIYFNEPFYYTTATFGADIQKFLLEKSQNLESLSGEQTMFLLNYYRLFPPDKNFQDLIFKAFRKENKNNHIVISLLKTIIREQMNFFSNQNDFLQQIITDSFQSSDFSLLKEIIELAESISDKNINFTYEQIESSPPSNDEWMQSLSRDFLLKHCLDEKANEELKNRYQQNTGKDAPLSFGNRHYGYTAFLELYNRGIYSPATHWNEVWAAICYEVGFEDSDLSDWEKIKSFLALKENQVYVQNLVDRLPKLTTCSPKVALILTSILENAVLDNFQIKRFRELNERIRDEESKMILKIFINLWDEKHSRTITYPEAYIGFFAQAKNFPATTLIQAMSKATVGKAVIQQHFDNFGKDANISNLWQNDNPEYKIRRLIADNYLGIAIQSKDYQNVAYFIEKTINNLHKPLRLVRNEIREYCYNFPDNSRQLRKFCLTKMTDATLALDSPAFSQCLDLLENTFPEKITVIEDKMFADIIESVPWQEEIINSDSISSLCSLLFLAGKIGGELTKKSLENNSTLVKKNILAKNFKNSFRLFRMRNI